MYIQILFSRKDWNQILYEVFHFFNVARSCYFFLESFWKSEYFYWIQESFKCCLNLIFKCCLPYQNNFKQYLGPRKYVPAQIWFVDHQFMKHKGTMVRPCHWTLTSEEGSTASERLVKFPCGHTARLEQNWILNPPFLLLSVSPHSPCACWTAPLLLRIESRWPWWRTTFCLVPSVPLTGDITVINAHLTSTRHFSAWSVWIYLPSQSQPWIRPLVTLYCFCSHDRIKTRSL